MILLQTGTGTQTIIMFAMIFVVMYFFMIRPQIRKQKKEHKYRDALKKGDSVITIGGIYGRITDVKKNVVIIDVHGGSKLKIAKTAISMNGDSSVESK